MKSKTVLILYTLLLANTLSFAQFSNQMRHHVIIAFDEARTTNHDFHANDYIRDIVIDRMLSDSIFRNGDYLSIIGFSINAQKKDMSQFTYVLNDSILGKMQYIRYSDSIKNLLYNNWATIASKTKGIHHGDLFSLISLAKMYALAPVKKNNFEQYVNKTYLIMISDHKYNGNDIYSEICNYYKYFSQGLSFDEIQQYTQNAVKEYFAKIIDYWQKDDNSDFQEHIDLFEYIPLQENISLHTILEYNAQQITATRGFAGNYNIELASHSRLNPHYNILKLHYKLFDRNHDILIDTTCNAKIGNGDYIPIDSFIVSYIASRHLEAANLHIDTWAGLCDGIYNATVLSPVDSAPAYLGHNGLSADIPIVYEKTAKILGLVPLPYWLMFLNDQELCNTIVSITIIILLVLFVICIVRILKRYNPSIKDLRIKKIN